MQSWTTKNMYFYILSSDVKSPWNYNPAFFDILHTTLSNVCVLNVRSYVFFELSFDCLSFFFFCHLIIPASSLRVLINRALYGDKFWFSFALLISHCFCLQTVACNFICCPKKKMHFNFYRNRSPVYPGFLVFVIWHPRWMVLLWKNCKKAGPLFGYD